MQIISTSNRYYSQDIILEIFYYDRINTGIIILNTNTYYSSLI